MKIISKYSVCYSVLIFDVILIHVLYAVRQYEAIIKLIIRRRNKLTTTAYPTTIYFQGRSRTKILVGLVKYEPWRNLSNLHKMKCTKTR